MSNLPEILAAKVRTPVLKWSDDEQMTMAERLDLARDLELVDDYEKSRWNMLSSGEQDMLSIAAGFRSLITGITHANIDEGLKTELGRAFIEYGGHLTGDLCDSCGHITGLHTVGGTCREIDCPCRIHRKVS